MGTHFFWDPVEDNIIQARDDTGTVTADYTTEPYLYGDLISQRRSGESRFHCFDGLGSTRALTDSSGNVTDTNAYSAFGEATEQTGSTETPFQYIGIKEYHRDKGTGQFTCRQRILSSSDGRWLTQDRMLFVDGISLYRYVRNAPTIFTDPIGNSTFTLDADSFIPWDWVLIPNQLPPPILASWVKGDDRGPSDTPLRKLKTKTFAFIVVNTCACDVGRRVIADCGGGNNSSTRRDLVVSPIPPFRLFYHFVTDFGPYRITETARTQCFSVGCHTTGSVYGWGRVPLIVAALPVGINFQYHYSVTHVGNKVWYNVSGTHDGFPAHEMYVTIDGTIRYRHVYLPEGTHFIGSPARLSGWYSKQTVATTSGEVLVDDDCVICCSDEAPQRARGCHHWRGAFSGEGDKYW